MNNKKNIFLNGLIDLAQSRLGTKIIYKTDEFFAPAKRIINPWPPVFKEGVFDKNGKWMDGWETRQWKINKIDEHNYEGTAGDVVGKAKGYSYGPAFKFEYVLLVPVKGKEMKITFDDWIFMQDERVAINRAKMTKFGIKVAELTVMFVKD